MESEPTLIEICRLLQRKPDRNHSHVCVDVLFQNEYVYVSQALPIGQKFTFITNHISMEIFQIRLHRVESSRPKKKACWYHNSIDNTIQHFVKLKT